MKRLQKINVLKSRIRFLIWVVIIGLVLSGLTAFPLETETAWLLRQSAAYPEVLKHWLLTICSALEDTNRNYPYLAYGTDWLAFAHLLLAVLFAGPLKDPIKNMWVVVFGIIACIAIFPLALISGHVRQIPLFWRLIDCSFGIIALVPLTFCYHYTSRLKTLNESI